MSGKDSSYMTRKKFYVPQDEVVRDYGRKDLTPADYLFDCDWDELWSSDDSD